MTVTEVATIPLVPGSDILDKGSNAANIWQGMCHVIQKQPGCQKLVFGQPLESPSQAQLFIDWDKIESHESFKQSPGYQPMLDSLKTLLAAPPELVHYELNPNDLAAAASAPVTELATTFLPIKSSSFSSNIEQFANVLTKHAQGFLGIAHGWSVEEVEHDSLGAGIQGRACLLAIGWQSVDHHMAFKETAAFQESLHLFKEVKSVEMHHVGFQTAR